MPSATYSERRGELETYFDRTAVDAWTKLTSDAPVGRIRATVRAGRNEMRDTLLSWLPGDLRGARLLDAGCGTGALAVEAARRGAQVVATDISPKLIALAQERAPRDLGDGAIAFEVGDYVDARHGRFDHVAAMDSLIHYTATDIVDALAALAARTSRSIVFTVAPRTPALAAMHWAGGFFPRGDRAPAIIPVAPSGLTALIARDPRFAGWRVGKSQRISSGFYKSHAMELARR